MGDNCLVTRLRIRLTLAIFLAACSLSVLAGYAWNPPVLVPREFGSLNRLIGEELYHSWIPTEALRRPRMRLGLRWGDRDFELILNPKVRPPAPSLAESMPALSLDLRQRLELSLAASRISATSS